MTLSILFGYFFLFFCIFGTKHKAHIGGCRSTPLCSRQKFGDFVAFMGRFYIRPIFGTIVSKLLSKVSFFVLRTYLKYLFYVVRALILYARAIYRAVISSLFSPPPLYRVRRFAVLRTAEKSYPSAPKKSGFVRLLLRRSLNRFFRGRLDILRLNSLFQVVAPLVLWGASAPTIGAFGVGKN